MAGTIDLLIHAGGSVRFPDGIRDHELDYYLALQALDGKALRPAQDGSCYLTNAGNAERGEILITNVKCLLQQINFFIEVGIRAVPRKSGRR